MPLPVETPQAMDPEIPAPAPELPDTWAPYMAGGVWSERDSASELRLLELATASSDASGSWVAVFDPVPLGVGWWGTIAVPSAPDGVALAVFIGSKQVGSPKGSTAWGPIAVLGGERVTVSGTGLAANTVYQAVWLGRMTKTLDVDELVAPEPSPGSLTAIVAPIDVEADYGGRTDYQPIYLGTAPPGTSTSAPLWQIRQLTYDGSSRLTSILNAVGAWTLRSTLTYS